MKAHIQIAIDGPSGAGKSTLSRAVAERLGIVYVDTGALYRTVGYFARSRGISLEQIDAVVPLLPEVSVEVRYEDGVQNVYLNGENLGNRIRENEISKYASAVATLPTVRAFLLDTQKKIARENSVIMDGRDIGTVILPDAQVKIFMTASDEARARRRCAELAEKGMPASYETILADMKARDAQDRNRAVAPAVAAPDAVLFDNSELTFEESVEELIRIITHTLEQKGVALS
ncbi:MAG: (d)CMP kinase [Eubacteriales bacterium]